MSESILRLSEFTVCPSDNRVRTGEEFVREISFDPDKVVVSVGDSGVLTITQIGEKVGTRSWSLAPEFWRYIGDAKSAAQGGSSP